MSVEQWKPVAGFEGLYEVSDFGQVRSLDRTVRSRGGTRVIPGRIRRPGLMTSGRYLFVPLHRPGEKAENCSVHRLVLEAFVGPCPLGMEALHGRFGSLDNRLSNLRWGTHLENEADKTRDGTRSKVRAVGEAAGRSKLTEGKVRELRRLRAEEGWTFARLGEHFGVTPRAALMVVHRLSWAHID